MVRVVLKNKRINFVAERGYSFIKDDYVYIII